jgi:ribosomal protein L39E
MSNILKDFNSPMIQQGMQATLSVFKNGGGVNDGSRESDMQEINSIIEDYRDCMKRKAICDSTDKYAQSCVYKQKATDCKRKASKLIAKYREKYGRTESGDWMMYEGGGKINEQKQIVDKAKENLSESFVLPIEMAVYVPSTKGADETISQMEFMSRIKETEEYLSELFGGYSKVDIDGGYVSETKGLIKEDVAKVVAFSQDDDFLTNKLPRLIQRIVLWCKDWTQESIGFELEGDLFYVDKDFQYDKQRFFDGGQTQTFYNVIDDDGDFLLMGADENSLIQYANTIFYYDMKDSGESEIDNLEDAIDGFESLDYRVERVSPIYASGGNLSKYSENGEMVKSYNKQIAHHTKEMANAISKNEDVPAWVVAKMTRSATDLSDATHYLDGKDEYGYGGSVKGLSKAEKKWLDYIKSYPSKSIYDYNLDTDALLVLQSLSANGYLIKKPIKGTQNSQYFLNEKMNNGGSVDKLLDVKHKIVNWRNQKYSKVGNRISPNLTNKGMNLSKKVDSFGESMGKTYLGAKSIKADGGEFGGGGMTDLFEDYESQEPKLSKIVEKINDAYDADEVNTAFLNRILNETEAIGYTFEIDMDGSAYGLRPINVPLSDLRGFEEDNFEGAFAGGGQIQVGDLVRVVSENKSGVVMNKISNGKHYTIKFVDGNKNIYDKNEIEKVMSDEDYDEYGDGGEFGGGGQSGMINFEVIVKTPKGLIRKKDFDGFTKKEIIEWCEARGWVYNQQGEKKGGNILKEYEFFIKTPTKYKVILPKKNDGGSVGKNLKRVVRKGTKYGKLAVKKAKPKAKKIVRKLKIGFNALANKVAKSYEGKAVAPKYQKEYGKRYSKEEAKEVGNKVAAKVKRMKGM